MLKDTQTKRHMNELINNDTQMYKAMTKPYNELTEEECIKYIVGFASVIHMHNKQRLMRIEKLYLLTKRLEDIAKAQEIVNPTAPSPTS